MTDFLPGLTPVKPPRIKSREFKISVRRECTAENAITDVPKKAVAYWRTPWSAGGGNASHPNFSPANLLSRSRMLMAFSFMSAPHR